jgi:hypothetical protein
MLSKYGRENLKETDRSEDREIILTWILESWNGKV